MLGTREEVPEYQRRPFILAGYRLRTQGCMRCVRSAMALHNETVNIWTHLLGLLPMAFWAWGWPGRLAAVREGLGLEANGQSTEWICLVMLYTLTLNCLFFSAFYHVRHCDVESVNYGCFYLDISGVILLLVSSLGVGVWLCFQCFPTARIVYSAGVIALLPTMGLSMASGGLSDGTRATVFSTCGLLGLIPAVHWVLVSSPSDAAILVPYIMGVLVCYGAGAAIYGARWPESQWPGRFDYCGQSHNIWHTCVFAGMLVWLTAMERMALLYTTRPSC